MKKAIRIIGICILVLAVLVGILSLVGPRVAKSYIEEHSTELVGRRIRIESISFNPFRFSVSVKGFALYEKDAATKFVAFREFYVNADPLRLLTGNICLSEVRLDSPYARVVNDGKEFNFSDILARFAPGDSLGDSSRAASPDTAFSGTGKDSAGSALPFGISVKRIAVLSGDVIYDDIDVNSHIRIQDFSLRIPEVYFSNRKTALGVNLEFADGGSLGVQSHFAMQSGEFSLAVKLSDFSLSAVKPYLESALNFKDLSGKLGVDISVAGNINDILASRASGTVSLDSVVLTENSDKTMGVSRVGVGIAEANLAENRFVIDSVAVHGAFAHFDLQKNTNNIEALLAVKKKPASKEPSDTAAVKDSSAAAKNSVAEAKPLDFLLRNFSVTDTRFALADYTVPKGFGYNVSGISVSASNVAMNREADVNVRATLPHGGSVRLSGKFVPSNLNSVTANVSVKNVAVKDFSVYSEHYTGYPITAGAFGFASDNTLKDGEIDSRNTIDIYNLSVGDKPSNAKPEYTVPMKIALYILKDKDGKIAFDVPVKGNINDPQFSYGKIIWQTVMNLMVKVALSPAKFLFGSSTPSEFEFDVAADDFTSEEYSLAAEWAKVLTEKPGSRLAILEAYSPADELGNFAKSLEKLEFYKASTGRAELSPVDRKAALETDESSEAFKAFDSTWTAPANETVLAEMEALSTLRREKLVKVLTAEPGVTAKNLTVRKANASELKASGKKAAYRMMVEFP